MIDVVITIYQFLFGLQLVIHVYDPTTQKFLIHPSKLSQYYQHWPLFLKFELIHILSSDGQPGGFYPVLPDYFPEWEFYGLDRFVEVSDWRPKIVNLFKATAIVNWGERLPSGPLITPFLNPRSGVSDEPQDYNFVGLDQNTSWKNVDVLLDDILRVKLYEAEYDRQKAERSERELSEQVQLESPSFTVSDSVDGYPDDIPISPFSSIQNPESNEGLSSVYETPTFNISNNTQPPYDLIPVYPDSPDGSDPISYPSCLESVNLELS